MKQIIEGQCLERYRQRYLRAGRVEKSKMLTDFCELTSCHRKHATRLFRKREAGRPTNSAKKGPKSRYDFPEIVRGLKLVYKATDQMCSVLLKGAMRHWLPAVEGEYGVFSPEVHDKLLIMSARTMERLLCLHNIKFPKSKGGTKPGTIKRTEIPIRQGIWDEDRPGFMESDTVSHGGASSQGEFAWSLTMTDIASHWTENRAVWHKGARFVVEAVKDIEEQIPFDLLGFDCDNGGEFINRYLIKYFTEDHPAKNIIKFTRSREYHKNDNAHVEQRNWSHPRQLFFRERLDQQALIDVMNDIYKNEFSLLRNHFYPTLKIDHKIMIMSRAKRVYGKALTPYERIITSPHIDKEDKDLLRAKHATLNPIKLKQQLDIKLKNFWTLLRKLKNTIPKDLLLTDEAIRNLKQTL